jgi:hypothetical protein
MTARKPRRGFPVTEKIQIEIPPSELQSVLAQFEQGSIRAKIQRENPQLKRWEHLGTIEPVRVDFVDDVKAIYGGGNYRAMLYNGNTYIKPNGYIAFALAGLPKNPGDDEIAAASTSAAPAGKTGVEWARDIAAVVTPVAAALATLVPLFRGNGAGTDVAQTVNMLHEAEERGERRGLTLGKLQSGNGGESGTMLDVAKAYAGPFFQMLANRQQQNAAAAAAPPAPPVSAPPQLQAPAMPAPPSGPELAPDYAFLIPMRPHYPILAAQALDDTDPEIIAEFVLAKMPEHELRAIAAATHRDDFTVTMRTELMPIYSNYPQWLDAFLTRIVEVCQGDDEPAQQPTPKKTRGRK